MRKILTILLCIFAFSSYAETPLINCNTSGHALQSTQNPPSYSCATISAGTPASPDRSVQINNSGAFGSSNWLIDTSSNLVDSPNSARGVFDILALTTVGNVNSPFSPQVNSGSGNCTANNNNTDFNIYAYKKIGGVPTVFSAVPLDFNITDDGSSQQYIITISWNPVAGADGYLSYLANDDNFGNTGASLDVGGNVTTSYCDGTESSYTFSYTPPLLSSLGASVYVDSTTGNLISTAGFKGTFFDGLALQNTTISSGSYGIGSIVYNAGTDQPGQYNGFFMNFSGGNSFLSIGKDANGTDNQRYMQFRNFANSAEYFSIDLSSSNSPVFNMRSAGSFCVASNATDGSPGMCVSNGGVLTGKNNTLDGSGGAMSVAGNITLTDAKNIIVGSTNGTKIGTATSQKLGFFNATPVVQQGATTDLGTDLSNLGFRASGTAYPITTSGTKTFSDLTASRPVITNGSSALTTGTYSGNTTTFGTTSGTLTSGHGAKFDASGNLVDSGSAAGTVTSIIASTGLSGGTITTTGTVSSNAVYQVSYQPGLLTAVTGTKSVYAKVSKTSTVDNIEGSSYIFSCVSNPTITFYECGTSSTCAVSPTTIGTVTVTAAGQVFDGTISNAAITAGDYIAWAITAGTCTSIDISATAQVHSN